MTRARSDFSDGFDNWVESVEGLQAHFREAEWVVDWQE
jgi:hypothetical protein